MENIVRVLARLCAWFIKMLERKCVLYKIEALNLLNNSDLSFIKISKRR